VIEDKRLGERLLSKSRIYWPDSRLKYCLPLVLLPNATDDGLHLLIMLGFVVRSIFQHVLYRGPRTIPLRGKEDQRRIS